MTSCERNRIPTRLDCGGAYPDALCRNYSSRIVASSHRPTLRSRPIYCGCDAPYARMNTPRQIRFVSCDSINTLRRLPVTCQSSFAAHFRRWRQSNTLLWVSVGHALHVSKEVAPNIAKSLVALSPSVYIQNHVSFTKWFIQIILQILLWYNYSLVYMFFLHLCHSSKDNIRGKIQQKNTIPIPDPQTALMPLLVE